MTHYAVNNEEVHTLLGNGLMENIQFGKNITFCGLPTRNLNFINCYFLEFDFEGIDLSECYFQKCYFYRCNFCGCKLTETLFEHCEIYDTTFYESSLVNSKFKYSYVNGCNFHNSDMSSAYFEFCSLVFSSFDGSILEEMWLYKCKTESSVFPTVNISKLPNYGEFIAWKKAMLDRKSQKPCIIKLLVTEDAKRVCAFGKKCRCDKAKVLEIQDLSGITLDVEKATSIFHKDFEYKVGDMVYANGYDPSTTEECSYGIHFFMSREDAVNF